MQDHKARVIYDRGRDSFIDSRAARKRAKGHACGEPIEDARDLYFVCSKECVVRLGIVW